MINSCVMRVVRRAEESKEGCHMWALSVIVLTSAMELPLISIFPKSTENLVQRLGSNIVYSLQGLVRCTKSHNRSGNTTN
jgi:hypothetical protein